MKSPGPLLEKIKTGWADPPIRWLILITAIAFALRVAGAGSSILYTPDNQLVREALDLGQSLTNVRKYLTQTDLKYPLALPIYLFTLYGILFVGGLAAGVYHSVQDFSISLFTHQQDIHLTAVAALAVIAVAVVPAIFLAARRLNKGYAAWLGACLAAGNLAMVQFGHQPRPHVALAALALIAVMLLVAVSRNAGWKTCLLATIVSAATWGALQNGMVIAVPFLIAWGVRLYDPADPHWWKNIFSRLALGNLALFAALALALNPALPGIVLDISRTTLAGGREINLAPGGTHHVSTALFTPSALPANALRLFNYQPLVTLVGLPGSLYVIWKLRKDRRLLAVALPFPAINAIAFGFYLNSYPRILIVLVPWLILAASYVVEDAATAAAHALHRPVRQVMGAVMAAILLPLAAADLRLDYVLAQPDTRSLAAEWVEANLPAGSGVMSTMQVFELLPTQDSLRLQASAAPRSIGTKEQWLLSLPADRYPPGPAYDIIEGPSYKATAPDSFDRLARARSVVVGLVDSDTAAVELTGEGMASYIFQHGSIARVICAARGSDRVYLPDDVEGTPAWIEIWKADRPGPVVFIVRLGSGSTAEVGQVCP